MKNTIEKFEAKILIRHHEVVIETTKDFDKYSKSFNRLIEIYALSGVKSDEISLGDPETNEYYQEFLNQK